jgi:hypothetical protein
MRARMRRFFRPTFRRPVPRRAPIVTSYNGSKTLHFIRPHAALGGAAGSVTEGVF